jgi:hypothetical protein
MARELRQQLRLELVMQAEVPPTTAFSGFAVRASHEDKPTAINPANSQEQKMDAAREMRTRIPMSVPRAKLATPEIPGFHVHWLNDYPGRILQAQQAGYEFVSQEEALVTMPDLAGSPVGAGTDLGSRVSVVVGKNEDGTPLRAYLMKLRQEWYREDQAVAQQRVDQIHGAIEHGKQQGDAAGDNTHRYVKSVSVKGTYSRRG